MSRFSLFLAVCVLAACASDEAATPDEGTSDSATEAPTDPPSDTMAVDVAPDTMAVADDTEASAADAPEASTPEDRKSVV